ncbi:MAG: hypothetical protein IJ252_03555 [Solobacterium sp.]|nr:hypothetical protein [Solobacterium sp.]
MKKQAVFPLILIPALLCGCAGSGSLPDEPYTAVDPQLFPAPEGAYVGDTMPYVTDEGNLELYYLYDTDHNGQGYHPIWRYSTDDLVGYEDLGMALNYGLMSDPDPALGTGSVMKDNEGLYHLFYTGHNDLGNGGKGRECVMHATSTDRETWTKHPEDTFFAPDDYSHDDFRDPEVFWMDEDNYYWMLIAARNNTDGGVVARYKSDDLKTWTFDGPIYAPMSQYMLECPDLVNINSTWYLTYSWDCVTYYAIGDSADGPFHAPADNILDGQGLMSGNGFVFYAAKTAQMEGHTYLCGWLGRAGLTSDSGIYQWAGNVLNHQLVQHDDKTLGVTAPESYTGYFTANKEVKAVKKQGNVKISRNNIELSPKGEEYALADMGTRPGSVLLECDVKLDGSGRAGFAFGGTESDPTWTALCLDADRNQLHYEGYEIADLETFDPVAVTRFRFEDGAVHHIKLVCENEIVVCYIDETKALSCRITHSIDGAHIGVFADGCSASFTNITMTLPN